VSDSLYATHLNWNILSPPLTCPPLVSLFNKRSYVICLSGCGEEARRIDNTQNMWSTLAQTWCFFGLSPLLTRTEGSSIAVVPMCWVESSLFYLKVALVG
jgi:hypothetical protein